MARPVLAIGAFLIIAWLVVAVLVGIGQPVLARLHGPGELPIEAAYWAIVMALVLSHAVMVRVYERRPWSWVALGRENARPGAILRGMGVGAAAIALPVVTLWAAGWLRVEGWATGSWVGGAARATLVLAPAALFEELLFRGYAFRVLRDAGGPLLALAVTSLAFGLLHLSNPGANARTLLLVTAAGVFLGSVLLATESVYAAWGAHLAWNWTMAVIFHVAVSGTGLPTPNYRLVDNGPDWMTGGSWGPEGGLAGGLGILAAMVLLIRTSPLRDLLQRRRHEGVTV